MLGSFDLFTLGFVSLDCTVLRLFLLSFHCLLLKNSAKLLLALLIGVNALEFWIYWAVEDSFLSCNICDTQQYFVMKRSGNHFFVPCILTLFCIANRQTWYSDQPDLDGHLHLIVLLLSWDLLDVSKHIIQ